MSHVASLRLIGVHVVRDLPAPKSRTLFLRVADPEHWPNLVTGFLLGSVGKEAQWTLDISKYFFADKGAVKYLWRIVIRGADVDSALQFLGQCALQAKPPKELDSFPLSEGLGTSSTQPEAS